MIKEQFYALIKACGFKGLRDFSRQSGILAGNVYSNVSGKFRPSIERMFIYADTLGVDINTVLWIFYKKEMEENHLTTIKPL